MRVQREPRDSGEEKLLAMLLRLRVERGQETTPAPALLVFMLATEVHLSSPGQYISAVCK